MNDYQTTLLTNLSAALPLLNSVEDRGGSLVKALDLIVELLCRGVESFILQPQTGGIELAHKIFSLFLCAASA